MSRVSELNYMEVFFESDLFHLVGRPELRVDALEEFNSSLVVLSIRYFRSFHKKRNPIVSTKAIEMSGVEVVSIDKVATILVNIDNNVDLLSWVNVVLSNASVGQSDESSLFVKSSVGTFYLVEPDPGEVAKDKLMGFLESIKSAELFNFLPFFIGSSCVEDMLVNF